MTNVTLTESVAAKIQELILKGQYLSGERLIELSLAKLLNVSQNTVRDALRILEQDGWVVKHARRGVYVRKFTLEEADEVFALLESVEALVLGWAIEAMNRTMLAELRSIVEAARRHAASGEGEEAIEMLFRFHERIAQASTKTFTLKVMQQLYNQARLLEGLRQARIPRNFHELNGQVRRHESMFFYIEEGDLENARLMLREQIAAYAEMVHEALALA